jgi:hypothetical protein
MPYTNYDSLEYRLVFDQILDLMQQYRLGLANDAAPEKLEQLHLEMTHLRRCLEKTRRHKRDAEYI